MSVKSILKLQKTSFILLKKNFGKTNTVDTTALKDSYSLRAWYTHHQEEVIESDGLAKQAKLFKGGAELTACGFFLPHCSLVPPP